MKSRSLGIIFIAAVIVPSILLAVLSIRAAGREEAFIERQLAATLEAQTTHAADLANAEVARISQELRDGVDVPAGSDYGRILARWKSASPLVSVAFLLSPRYGILWPAPNGALDAEQKRFLKENGDFLSDTATTTVLQNIAVKYQDLILAETQAARNDAALSSGASSAAAGSTAAPSPEAEAQEQAAAVSKEREAAATPGQVNPAEDEASAEAADGEASTSNARQMALDAFAQSADLQGKVYAEARARGDQVATRNVQPSVAQGLESSALQRSASQSAAAAPAAGTAVATSTAAVNAAAPAPAAVGGESGSGSAAAAAQRMTAAEEPASSLEATNASTALPAGPEVSSQQSAPSRAAERKETQSGQAAAVTAGSPGAAGANAAQAPLSQYVVTSQLLSQIAAQGDAGIIPRFIGERIVFLFWERQKDGRIAGCEIAGSQFRARVVGVLSSTYRPGYILTFLDELGSPLAAPPGAAVSDWRRPFVSEPIGEALPRWEAAAYLTNPSAIASQARASSMVIWVMVAILFVSVAGGGAMVLSSVGAEMRLAQKKATFVTNVSHELKTPLTSISLFIDLLRTKQPPPTKREQYLGLMAAETERLTRLINNVLTFSAATSAKGQRYARRLVDAAAVVEEIVESQRVRLASRGFGLAKRLPAGAAPVLADPEALKQVLLNLLSNAEKYSPSRKEIDVEVEADPSEPDGTVLLIHVRDRGIGVPEKERQRIFREFYRVDDSLASGVQGTGLGLTIARRIIRDHGGDITCQPREGGGSDFIISLPAAARGGGKAGGGQQGTAEGDA